MTVNQGINRGVQGSNPWVVLLFSTWLAAQPIVVPNSPHPYKPLAFALLLAANPPSNLFTTTTRHAGPSQMSQPLARLHQMTVVCPSDPNRIPLLHRRI